MLLHYDVQEKRVQTHGCKRVYGIRSFAYRMPHPHPAAACRLRLPRIWNPSFILTNRLVINVRRMLKNKKIKNKITIKYFKKID